MTTKESPFLGENVSNQSLFLTKFSREDLKLIDIQESQEGFEQFFPEENLDALEKLNHSYSFYNENDEVVTICGLIPTGLGEGTVWSLHSKDFKKYHKTVATFLRTLMSKLLAEGEFQLFKSSHTHDLKCGERWMKFLGFEKVSVDERFSHYERKVPC